MAMKNRFYLFGMLAAAALAFVSCDKEQEPEIEEARRYVEVTFTKVNQTRTAVVEGQDGASYIWTQGDDAYMHIYENGEEGTVEGISYSQDMSEATLTVSFAESQATSFEYTATYGSNLSSGGNPLIPAEQRPTTSSFDPAADVMISKVISSPTALSSLKFTMGRAVTVNKMTLTGLDATEKVSRVEFELDSYMSSRYSIKDKKFTGDSKKLTFIYDEAAVSSEGIFPVYFVSAPVDAAGIVSVVVTTDKNVYKKSSILDPNPFDGKTITFAVGTMKRFNMAMAGYGEEIDESVRYFEVTSDDEIVDGGTYLITSTKSSGDAVAMGAYNTGKYFEATDVTITADASLGNYIDISSEQVIPVTLKDAGDDQFYIKDADGKYMSYSGSSNNVSRGDAADGDAYKWNVGAEGISSANVSGRKLQYNASSPRFACYTGSLKAIALYYKEGSITVIPALAAPTNVEAEVSGSSILVTWTDISAPTGETVKYKVTCTGQEDQTVDQGEGGCFFENLADGTYAITVTAIPSTENYKNSSTTTIQNLEVSTAAYYVKVTSNLADWSGQYLIVYETGNVAFNGGLTTLDATSNTIPVTISSSKIVSNATTDAAAFTIAAVTGGYSIRSTSGYYIGRTATSNGLNSSTSEAYVNTISYNNGVTVTSSANPALKYNKTSGQTRFRYFASGQEAISLYKLADNREDAGMSWSANEASATITSSGITFTAPDLTPGKATGITFNSTKPEVASIDASTGEVTIQAEGTTTIQAIFAGNDTYKADTKEYTLTVTDAREIVATPTFSPSAGEVVTNTVVTISSATQGATIYYTTDGSEPTTASTKGASVTITEDLTIKAIAVKDGYKDSEVASAAYIVTVTTVGSGTKDDPYTAGDILDKYPEGSGNTQVYVTGTITEITEVSTQFGNATYTISDGSRSILVYRGKYIDNAAFTSEDQIAVNDIVVVFGIIGVHSNAPQLAQNNYLISITADPNAPTLSVNPETTAASPASWAADNDDAKEFTVTATNGTWSFNADDVSSWANVSRSGDILTVTPKEKQASEAHSGSIVITLTPTNSGYENKTATIYLSQAKYGAGGTPKTSTLTFTAKCYGSGTADDNVSWTVTSDGSESTFDDTKGIHYGTNSGQVTYIKLSTSGITGTITQVVVNASTASGVSATASVTVGGNAFGGNAQSLSTTASDYTFTGSAQGEIAVTVTKPSKAAKAIYVKSVIVTYNN